jgi:outer membrane protein TolC
LKDAEAVQAAAEDRYKRGIGTVVEVAQTRQATAEARLVQVQADGAAENSYLALISAMGISPLTELAIADISRRKLPAAMTVPIERFVSTALAQRPDVLTGYAAQLGVSGTQFGTTALVGATMPLYDGGSRAALLEQARNKVDQADTTLTQLRNEAVRQIILARNTLKTSLSAYAASMALAAAGQTTFDAALSAYRNGVGSITDVTTAERQLLAAKNAATDAYSTALSAAATLALSSGLLGSAPGR